MAEFLVILHASDATHVVFAESAFRTFEIQYEVSLDDLTATV
jgi:hypothetical protein